MRVILIDDEYHCLGTLEILLHQHCPELEIIGKATNGEEGIKMLSALSPDLVFLDIEMPKLNGFEMLAQMSDINFKIIFTTAYDTYAIRAFKVSAVDYLLKPIDKNELIQAVSKVKSLLDDQRAVPNDLFQSQVNVLLDTIRQQNDQNANLALPTLSGLEMIKIEDILFMESDGNYARIIKANKEVITISKTLKYLEEKLDGYNFVRIHHSHIINLDRLKRYVQGDGGYVILENDQHLNVARRKKPLLMEKLNIGKDV